MKKKKYTYYICYQEDSVSPIEDELELEEEFTEEDLLNRDVKFLIDASQGEVYSYSDSRKDSDVYKNNKLSELIDDFIFDVDIDPEEIEEMVDEFMGEVDDRLNFLLDELMVFRYDPSMKLFKFIPGSAVMKCFDQVMDNSISKSSVISGPKSTISSDYIQKFTKFLDLCFTEKATGGILTVSTKYEDIVWDVKKVDGEYFFGLNEQHNTLFGEKLADYFLNKSAGVLRVFTNQMVNNIPVKELYGFVLLEDTQIINIDYLELKECQTNVKGGILLPEPNIVYCDLNGNKLCSED
jgi:hypothetical protein